MIEFRIARRYLWAARKQKHTAFLSAISMLGLAVGVAALLISIALLSGLQGRIKQQLIAASPQVLVEPAGQNTIGDSAAIVAAGRQLGMTSVRPIITGIAWGANELQERGRPMRIRSTTQPMSDAAIAVTRGYAASVTLNTGETVTVLAPRMRLTPFGPVPVWKKYRITRLLTGEAADNTDAVLSMEEASRLFGTGGEPTSIEMYGPHERAEAVQAALAARFPKAQFKTWKEINRPLVLALRLEKIVMFATISLIIFVAALNLISSLSMLIMEKRPSVGILRTVGATNKTVLSIFMQVGLLIGLLGTLLGNLLGLGFAWAANRWHLVPLPTDVYFVSYLPFELDVQDIVVVNLIAVTLSILATWYPARVASRLDPIAAIQE